MNLLMVTDKMHIGGAETHVVTLIENLAARGIRITLLSSGGVYTKRISSSGARCVFAPLDKRDPISILRSASILREEMKSADIVHTHTRYTSRLAASIRGNGKYPPIVATAHLDFPSFPFGPISFFGDKTLAVSEDIKEGLRSKYSINEDAITVTRNSIDPEIFVRQRCPKKLIVHTSRIDKGRAKCAFALVAAAQDIIKRFPEHKILIIGTGNCFGKLKAAADSANARIGQKAILLAGGTDDVPSLLKYAEVFVGVSRAALEAMAFGIPTVIAGDEGYGGIIYEANFDELAKSNFCARGMESLKKERLLADIFFMLENAPLRASIGEYCKGRILSEFAPDAMANDALRVYKSVLEPPRVCLLGYFGYGNLGDEESLRRAIDLLREYKIRFISVLTRNGELSILGASAAYDRMNPYDVAEAIRRSDAVILAGGNLLQNETSARSLLYYTAILRHAKNAGKRIYAISSGIGRLKGGSATARVKRCLSDFSAIGLRTRADIDTAKRLSVWEASLPMPDLCFLMDQGKKPEKPTRFGIILSGDTSFSLSEIAAITRDRALLPEIISLFPEDDESSIKRFSASGISCIAPKCAEELGQALASCAFTVSERLHGAIFSVIFHVPTYIRANEGKALHLLTELTERAKEVGASPIAHQYSLQAVRRKKEVGACDSDFNNIILSLQKDIRSAASKMFGTNVT